METTHPVLGVAAALALLASQPAAASDNVYNGGFELPDVPVGGRLDVGPGQTVGGWQVLGGGGSIFLDTAFAGGGVQWPGAYEGSDYLYLNTAATNGVSINQSISLEAGQTYHLSFAMAGVILPGPIARQPAVTVQVESATNSFAGAAGAAWQTFEFDVTPVSGGATTLKFTSKASLTDLGITAVMLDGIAVQAVPEPATYALMLFGLAALTAARRLPR